MKQEFGFTWGWKIFSYTASAIFAIVGVGMSCVVVASGQPVLLLISIPLFFAAVYMLISTGKYKLTITENEIFETGIFTTIVIHITDIDSFKIDGKTLTIRPRQNGQKRIRINGYQYLENNELLISWLYSGFDDFNQKAYIKETEEIRNNADFGVTDEEKAATFKRARLIAQVYNALSVGFLAAPFINTHLWLNTTMLLYPFVGVLLLFLHKGVIRMESTGKTTNYPYISLGLIMPSLCLAAVTFTRYEVISYANLWIPVLVIGVILFVLLNEANKKSFGDAYKSQFVHIVIIIVFYVFGSAVIINCDFDRSVPTIATAKVIKQFKTTNKITTYSLTLSPWGDRRQPEDVLVTTSVYKQVSPGEVVRVNIKSGFFKMPWFYVEKK